MTATSLRRRALRTSSIALGLALALSAPAIAADLVISNWDGYMAPDAMAAFKTATGVSGEVVVHATNEEIMGKLIAAGGKGYDVVFVSSPFAEVLNKLGLTEPIDHAKVPNLANLYPQATKLPNDVGNTFSVPYTWGTVGLAINKDAVLKRLVPGGTLHMQLLETIANAPDAAAAMDLLSGTRYQGLGEQLYQFLKSNRFAPVERLFDRLISHQLRRLALRDPFGIGVVMDYVWLKFNEGVNLRLIARGLAGSVPMGRVRDELFFQN